MKKVFLLIMAVVLTVAASVSAFSVDIAEKYAFADSIEVSEVVLSDTYTETQATEQIIQMGEQNVTLLTETVEESVEAEVMNETSGQTSGYSNKFQIDSEFGGAGYVVNGAATLDLATIFSELHITLADGDIVDGDTASVDGITIADTTATGITVSGTEITVTDAFTSAKLTLNWTDTDGSTTKSFVLELNKSLVYNYVENLTQDTRYILFKDINGSASGFQARAISYPTFNPTYYCNNNDDVNEYKTLVLIVSEDIHLQSTIKVGGNCKVVIMYNTTLLGAELPESDIHIYRSGSLNDGVYDGDFKDRTGSSTAQAQMIQVNAGGSLQIFKCDEDGTADDNNYKLAFSGNVDKDVQQKLGAHSFIATSSGGELFSTSVAGTYYGFIDIENVIFENINFNRGDDTTSFGAMYLRCKKSYVRLSGVDFRNLNTLESTEENGVPAASSQTYGTALFITYDSTNYFQMVKEEGEEHYGKLLIENSTFTNLKANQNGGAILYSDGNTASNDIEVVDCSFNSCSAANGGVMYLGGKIGALDITGNTTFTDCQATGSGGAICFNGNASGNTTFGDINLSGATFTGCTATNDGGAVCFGVDSENAPDITVNSINVSDCTFGSADAACSATNGGAIFMEDGCTVTETVKVLISTFAKCSATNNAGAIRLGGTITGVTENSVSTGLLVEDSEFVSCEAGNDGGAINVGCKVNTSFNISNSSFGSKTVEGETTTYTKCTAGGYGAAICFGADSTLEKASITDTTFTACEGVSSGAIAVNGTITTTLNVEDSSFDACKATAGHGGAFRFDDGCTVATINLLRNTYNSCTVETGYSGGAMFVRGTIGDFNVIGTAEKKTTFTNCTAGEYGGAIIFATNQTVGNVTVNYAEIDGSSANIGGAISFGGTVTDTLSISNTAFTNCTATQAGGAIMVNGTSGKNNFKTVLFSACTFTDCKSDTSSGGALYVGGSCKITGSITVTGSSFNNCTANANGGALRLGGNIYAVKIEKSAFDSCQSINSGGAVYFGSAGCTSFELVGDSSTKTTFNNCKSTTGSGGAIYITYGSVVNTTDPTAAGIKVDYVGFTKCIAAANAGALHIGGSGSTSVQITNSNFTSCESGTDTTSGSGGAVYVNTSNFTNFTVGAEGEKVTFTDCYAKNGGGGAIYFADESKISNTTKFDYVDFIRCTSNAAGGAVRFSGAAFSGDPTAKLLFSNATFNTCKALHYSGGGIYITSEATVNKIKQDVNLAKLALTNSSFKDCSAAIADTNASGYYQGGAVAINAKKLTDIDITDTYFDNCDSKSSGGTLYVKSAVDTFDFTDSRDNPTNGSYTIKNANALGGNGGGICFSADGTIRKANISGVSFYGCEAHMEGGGIFYTSSTPSTDVQNNSSVKITDSYFGNCKVNYITSPEDEAKFKNLFGNGGAIIIGTNDQTSVLGASGDTDVVLDLSGNTIENCSATRHGAGVRLRGKIFGITEMNNTTIKGCRAEKYGGAIDIYALMATFNIKNITIQNCIAGTDGSAIILSDNYGSVKNLNIINPDISYNTCLNKDNDATGTVRTFGGTTCQISIQGGKLHHNYVARHGGAIYFNAAGVVNSSTKNVHLSTSSNPVYIEEDFHVANSTLTIDGYDDEGDGYTEDEYCYINNNVSNNCGGGLYIESDSTIKHTNIHDNYARVYGGGICQQVYNREENDNYNNTGLYLNLDQTTKVYNNYARSGGGVMIHANQSKCVAKYSTVPDATPGADNTGAVTSGYYTIEFDLNGAEVYNNASTMDKLTTPAVGAEVSARTINCNDSTIKDYPVGGGGIAFFTPSYDAEDDYIMVSPVVGGEKTKKVMSKNLVDGYIKKIVIDRDNDDLDNLGEEARVHDNTTQRLGGGIYMSCDANASIEVNNCQIYENKATKDGGGIYAKGSLVNVTQGTINNNEAGSGGGVCVEKGGHVKIAGGYVTNNRATGENDKNTAKGATYKGSGGGVLVLDGASKDNPSKFTLVKGKDAQGNDLPIGIHSNIAAFSADDVYASGVNTLLNVPIVDGMNLGNAQTKVKGWFEDYHSPEINYLTIRTATEDFTSSTADATRYKTGTGKKYEVAIDSDDTITDGLYANRANTFVCMTLGIQGGLSVSKQETGYDGSSGKEYKFRITIKDGDEYRALSNVVGENETTSELEKVMSHSGIFATDGVIENETFRDFNVEGSIGTFYLKHSEGVTFYGLNGTYKIEEFADGDDYNRYVNSTDITLTIDENDPTKTEDVTVISDLTVDTSDVNNLKEYKVLFENELKTMGIQFKYYERAVIDGKPADMKNTPTAFTVKVLLGKHFEAKDTMDWYTSSTTNYGKLNGEILQAMVVDAATKFSSTGQGKTLMENDLDEYIVFNDLAAAQTAIASYTNLRTGATYKNDYFTPGTAEAAFHTNWYGYPQTGGSSSTWVVGEDESCAGLSDDKSADNEKWLNYLNASGTLVSGSQATSYENASDIATVRVWLYNTPKVYNVYAHVANNGDQATLIKGSDGLYVGSNTEQTFGSYYNQRFGGKLGDAIQDANTNHLAAYNIQGYTDEKPETIDYISIATDSKSYKHLKFAYWSFDPQGKNIATTEKVYQYRILNDLHLYAIYREESFTQIGLTALKNKPDIYVDEDGVEKTRLNTIVNPYNCQIDDTNIKQVGIVYVMNTDGNLEPTEAAALTEEIRAKIKAGLIDLNIEDKTTNSSGTLKMNITNEVAEVIEGVKGNYRIYYTNNGELLTNRNRVEISTSFNSSVLIGKDMYAFVTMYYNDGADKTDWYVSDNYVQYSFSEDN